MAKVREGILALAKYSTWSRRDIRDMTADEFSAYVDAANALERSRK